MRAVWYEKTGAASEVLILGERPVPQPAPGEVRVRLHASGVNPSDTKSRSGWRGRPMAFPLVIPHQDGAGVIDAVGAGVPEERVGERVWVYEAQLGRPFGTCAEHTTVPASKAVRLPEAVDFVAGACLGIPAMTAHYCLFADGPVEGQTVLVTGGAGSVGHAAVQLARWGGARVIATVSSEEKAAAAREAGADHVVDYRREDVASRVEEVTDGAGVHRIVEVAFGANFAISAAVLRPNGAIATYASDADIEPRFPFYALLAKNIAVRFALVYVMDAEAHARAARDVNRCLEEGRLRPRIAAVHSLEEAAAAHDAVETGRAIGNVVVRID